MECGFDEAERGGAGPERLVASVCSLIDEGGVSQVGIRAHAPPGVVGEVPVQDVEAVASHDGQE